MIFTISENKKKIQKNKDFKAGRVSALGLFGKDLARRVIYGISAAIFWFIIWYAFAVYIDKEIILPKPTNVLLKLVSFMNDSEFWISCGVTIIRIIIGTALGCATGVILALIMLVSRIARALVSPLLSAVKATPVASFIIAALFWISRGHVPAFISFLIVLPVVCDSVYNGVKNVDKELLEVTQVYKFSMAKKLVYLYIPSAVPYFLTAVRTSIGMAWKSGVAAEVLCTPSDSIGKSLYLTKVYMETTDMFAWTLTIIVLSMIFEKITVGVVGIGLRKYGVMTEVQDAED